MTFDQFKNTFRNPRSSTNSLWGNSSLKPNGKERIEIRGFNRGGTIDYPNNGIRKWRCNYGRFNKTYKSFDDALRGVYRDLNNVIYITKFKSSKTIKNIEKQMIGLKGE